MLSRRKCFARDHCVKSPADVSMIRAHRWMESDSGKKSVYLLKHRTFLNGLDQQATLFSVYTASDYLHYLSFCHQLSSLSGSYDFDITGPAANIQRCPTMEQKSVCQEAHITIPTCLMVQMMDQSERTCGARGLTKLWADSPVSTGHRILLR